MKKKQMKKLIRAIAAIKQGPPGEQGPTGVMGNNHTLCPCIVNKKVSPAKTSEGTHTSGHAFDLKMPKRESYLTKEMLYNLPPVEDPDIKAEDNKVWFVYPQRNITADEPLKGGDIVDVTELKVGSSFPSELRDYFNQSSMKKPDNEPSNPTESPFVSDNYSSLWTEEEEEQE